MFQLWRLSKTISSPITGTKSGTTVGVTSKVETRIPKAIREYLDIETPGSVHFVENEHGDVVIRPVKRPSEIRGALGCETPERASSAIDRLYEERQRDKQATEERRERLDEE